MVYARFSEVALFKKKYHAAKSIFKACSLLKCLHTCAHTYSHVLEKAEVSHYLKQNDTGSEKTDFVNCTWLISTFWAGVISSTGFLSDFGFGFGLYRVRLPSTGSQRLKPNNSTREKYTHTRTIPAHIFTFSLDKDTGFVSTSALQALLGSLVVGLPVCCWQCVFVCFST